MKNPTLAPVSPGVEGEESTLETTMLCPSMPASNDATDNSISRYFSPTARNISPLSLLLTLHTHAPFQTHMHTLFFFVFFFLGSVMWPDVQVDIALKAFDWMKQCIGCG